VIRPAVIQTEIKQDVRIFPLEAARSHALTSARENRERHVRGASRICTE
jgi:hypothetical protein